MYTTWQQQHRYSNRTNNKSNTTQPTLQPSISPSKNATYEPTYEPTNEPTNIPTNEPTIEPTINPTITPTQIFLLFVYVNYTDRWVPGWNLLWNGYKMAAVIEERCDIRCQKKRKSWS